MSYANPDAVTQIANGLSTTTYAYDNNGNLVSSGNGTATTTYTYDYANRLIALNAGGATTTYGYDAFGQRVIQTGTSTTTIYPFKWYSVASSTGTGAKYATTTSYMFNGDTLLATVDQQTASGVATGTAQTRFIHPDHLGSTNVVTDQNDNLVQTLDYYPYGGLRVSTGTSTNEQRKYIGQFRDQSNLDYLSARYYSSAQGQFISQDPVFWGDPKQQNLRDPQTFNTYSYSQDNPIIKSDPNGRAAGTGGVDFSAWNFTGSTGIDFDQYGIDYYYGWGIAAGVHTGANAGITTGNLSHTYSLTSSVFGASGDLYGGEISYGMTAYLYSKKPAQQSMVMTGGINFGDAGGVRTVVSGPLIVWGSRPHPTIPTAAEVLTQNPSLSAPKYSWALPPTVSVGGMTYYRNYSGLLSTTVTQTTKPVIGSTINGMSNTSASGSGGSQPLFQLHAIVPH
jgi:RHS repeat-associated protein